MQITPQISFQNMDRSDALVSHIEDCIADLENFHSRITACRVVVDTPHRHSNKGMLYAIRIDLTVPGKEINVSRESGQNHAHEDVYVAVRDAFDAARRLLEDHARSNDFHRQKRHPEIVHGHIDRLFEDQGYGFITAENGEEVYFQEDNLTKLSWDRLHKGQKVRFKQMDGDKGPFAVRVAPHD